MSELDLFEARFAATYRRYLEEAPTEVDATEVARTVAAAPHRARMGVWPWALRPAPALAWLVLLALLLAALGAAALFVGSRRPALGFACPPGTNPDAPGPVDQARPVTRKAVAFDRRAGTLVALAGAGASVETWTFDVCTNTWARMHPNREPSFFELRQLVYDVDSDVTIVVSYWVGWGPTGKVWAYDLQANTWTEKGVAPTDARPWAYDPVSGLVVAAGDAVPIKLWNYDVETDTWTPIHQANGPEYGVFAYDASVDRIVAYDPTETWLFDLRTGTWSRSGAETPVVLESIMAIPDLEYDEAAERTMLIGNVRLAAYDATADRWEIVAAAADPFTPLPHPLVYDPVNERLVGLGRGAIVEQGGVVAFDARTRQWTVLLEPSERQPWPSSP